MALFHFSNPASDNPNKAKSYFTGSFASYIRKFRSNSSTAFQSDWFRDSSPNNRAVRPEWTSNGIDNCDGEMLFHIPKSTPRSSRRTIQRKNIFMRFAVLFLSGLATCFHARCVFTPTNSFRKYSMASFEFPRENPSEKTPSIPLPSTYILRNDSIKNCASSFINVL